MPMRTCTSALCLNTRLACPSSVSKIPGPIRVLPPVRSLQLQALNSTRACQRHHGAILTTVNRSHDLRRFDVGVNLIHKRFVGPYRMRISRRTALLVGLPLTRIEPGPGVPGDRRNCSRIHSTGQAAQRSLSPGPAKWSVSVARIASDRTATTIR